MLLFVLLFHFFIFLVTTVFAPSFFLFAQSALVLLIKFDLYFNDEEFSAVILIKAPLLFIGCSSLLNYHKLPEVSEQLPLYSIKLYIGIVILIKFASSTKVSLISVLHFLNGAKFLNATFITLSPAVTLIFPVTKIYASE